MRREELERNFAIKLSVLCQIHLTHTTGADLFDNPVKGNRMIGIRFAMLANAPWVVAAIVVALLLGALLNPAKTPQPALGWYQHSGLQTLEWNNYLCWLRFNGQGKLAGQLQQQLAAGDVHAFSAAMLSPAFVTDSEQRARDFWSPAQRDTWSALRQQVPGQLAASNLYRWGLADSSPRPARFFTAPFTGGPWSAEHQHGGAVSALMARALEAVPTPVQMRLARISLDMFRGVPLEDLRVETRIIRAGLRIQAIEARLLHGDHPVAHA
ncbi:MAG: thioesterase family protein, partial [Delftia sp.]|nr:thioesterase family protein [Delftia sp.]